MQGVQKDPHPPCSPDTFSEGITAASDAKPANVNMIC